MIKVALLICSCDFYSECWEPMIYSIKKYWSDCEYDKLIVSNHKDWQTDEVRIIKVGDHKGWASDTLKAVSLTDYDYYIYFQEDYFLNKEVDNDAIKAHVQHCANNHVEYLKIQPDAPQCDQYRIGDSDYCKNPLNKKYTINTAIAIWHRSLFEKVCVSGFTGWDFEYKIIDYLKEHDIQINSEVLHSFVIYEKGMITIVGNAIQRGKWTPAGVNFLKANGFEELVGARKIQNRIYSFFYLRSPKNKFIHLGYLAFLRVLRYLKIN